MLVKKFLQNLENHPDQPLLFEYALGKTVPGGYHVTEIKNASFETIDCGNSLHTWQEVIVQVWLPDEARPDDEVMSAGKFLKIWGAVAGRIPLAEDGEIRIEFHDPDHLPAVYHVDGLTQTADGVKVQMAPTRTLCKPREILVPLNDFVETAASCCTPNPVHEGEKAIPLAVAAAEQYPTASYRHPDPDVYP